jgi:hypothetical protein
MFLIQTLHKKGAYIITERASLIKNDYIIKLESDVNDLYRELYEEYEDEYGNINKKALIKVIEDIESNLIAAVAEWNDFANKNPEKIRPEKLFKNIKPIGRKLIELSNRL